ncbi:hypothetical protein FIBSPDRAFT_859487 [Athelia psychrophila]|uniref:DUF1349-domain-containing protein n=1 Tax=Athelia psychrophila TaxID=1759441 RepID=A0A166KZW8_9AGAM|nr:hypothetical protein FIBSPDRAFT_859487 [Fibularhizoctonia sp. CBS 109695]
MSSGVPISFNDSQWTHLNTPTSPPAISRDGTQISVLTEPKTDWWRTTSIDSRSGVVYGFKRGVGNGFEVSVDLGIDHQVQTGVEYHVGKLWNSVVITNPYSDWSLQPWTPSSSTRFTISLKDRILPVYLGDTMIREVHAFGQGDDTEEALVGVMACSPLGGGVKATFQGFQMREGVR